MNPPANGRVGSYVEFLRSIYHGRRSEGSHLQGIPASAWCTWPSSCRRALCTLPDRGCSSWPSSARRWRAIAGPFCVLFPILDVCLHWYNESTVPGAWWSPHSQSSSFGASVADAFEGRRRRRPSFQQTRVLSLLCCGLSSLVNSALFRKNHLDSSTTLPFDFFCRGGFLPFRHFFGVDSRTGTTHIHTTLGHTSFMCVSPSPQHTLPLFFS